MLLKSFAKRSLAVVLCAVMLLSCWVFTAPTASAVDQAAGSYYVEIDVIVKGTGDFKNTYKGPYFTKDSGYKAQAGITLFYKRNNGTLTETMKNTEAQSAGQNVYNGERYKSFDLGKNGTVPIKTDSGTSTLTNLAKKATTNQVYTIYTTIDGFPTSFAAYSNRDGWFSDNFAEWYITEVRVGAVGDTPKALWTGQLYLSNKYGDKAPSYKVNCDGTAERWDAPSGFVTSAGDGGGRSWVWSKYYNGGDPNGVRNEQATLTRDDLHGSTKNRETYCLIYTDGNDGSDDYYLGDNEAAYRCAWALPQPTYNSFSFANSGSYTAADGVTATLSANYTYKTPMTDQYGVQLAGSFSDGGFAWASSEISANGTDWSTDSSGVTVCNFDNTSSLYNVGITPVKANSSRYHRFGVKPSTHWTINGSNVNVNGATDGMYYGQVYNDIRFSSYDAVSTVTFDYAPHAVTYQYKTTGTPLGLPANSNGIYDSMTAANVNAVDDADTNTGYAAFYGDDVTTVPAVGTYSATQYYDESGHYAAKSPAFTAYGTLTADDTKLMNYDKTDHDWSDWAQIPDKDITEGMSPATYHRRLCDAVVGEEHYQYQEHIWDAGEVTTSPTCSANGIRTLTCTECGAKKTKDEPYDSNVNHNYNSYEQYTASQHYKVCSYNSLHKEPENHSFSTWSHVAPTPGSAVETALNAYLEDNEIASFDPSVACYRYCNQCYQIEYSAHAYSSEVTTEATCSAAGVRTYTCDNCANSYTEPIAQLSHSFTEKHMKEPEDTKSDASGFVYFACSNGCGQYKAGTYNSSERKYKATGSSYDTLSDVERNINNSDKIPAPLFNDSETSERIYQSFDYSKRLASFKYMSEGESGKQTVRFAGSVKIPAGIGYTDVTAANNIVDFGFVYTQDERIDNASNMVIGGKDKKGFDIQKMSVRENNSQKDAQGNLVLNDGNIDNWSGCSVQTNETGVKYITFNLVININAKNWHKEYACRPYIVYNYNGNVYTVYDSGVSSGEDDEGNINITYFHRSVNSLADSIMKFYQYFDLGGTFIDSEGYEVYVEQFISDNYLDQKVNFETFSQIAQRYIDDKAYVEDHIIAHCDGDADFTNKAAVKENLFTDKSKWLYSSQAEYKLNNDVIGLFPN